MYSARSYSPRNFDAQEWKPGPWHVYPKSGTSLFIFSHRNPFRLMCFKFVSHRYTFILWTCLAVLSTALAAAVQPKKDIGRVAEIVLFSIQTILLTFFWVRMIAEIIATGFLLHPHSFIRSFWNIAELVVNVFGIIQLIPPTNHYYWMRSFTVVRPLRFILCAPFLLPVILPIIREAPLLVEAVIFFLMFLASFALIGVFLIGGHLDNRCYITSADPNSSYASLVFPFRLRNVTSVCGNFFHCPIIDGATVECLNEGLTYTEEFFTFNNIGSGMLLIFKTAMFDNWSENLENIMNSHGQASALLLVCAVIISFCFKCLSLAVVHESYARTKMNSRALRGKAHGDGKSFTSGRQRSVSVQAQETELASSSPTCALSPHRLHHNVLSIDDVEGENPFVVPSTLSDSFELMMITEGTERESEWKRFAPYPGSPVILTFLRAFREKGFWKALRDQERSLYGPIYRNTFSFRVTRVIDSVYFCLFLIILSLTNLLLLLVTWDGMNRVTYRHLMMSSSVCSFVYIIPVLLKCLSFGPKSTMCDLWNVCDALSAITGLLELAVPRIFENSHVSGLRTLRILRVGKYIPYLRNFKHYFDLDLLYVAIFIGLTLILYAILGLQLFGHSYHSSILVRESFGTFWDALLMCFIIFTGDNWALCLRGTIDGGTPVTGIIYFVSLFAVSVLQMNLLISIMVDRFEFVVSSHEELDRVEVPPLLVLPVYDPPTHGTMDAMNISISERVKHGFLDDIRHQKFYATSTVERWFAWLLSSRTLKVRSNSLFLFEPRNPLRQLFLSVLGSLWFRILTILCIILGIISLFFERRDNSYEVDIPLRAIHITYTAFFSTEMFMKWIAYGLLFPVPESDPIVVNPHMAAYLRYPLNWIDLVANCLSFVGIYYRPCRVAKSVQFIRLMTSTEYPNVLLKALTEPLIHVWNAILLLVYFFVIFTVMGMQFFSGRLHYCSDLSVGDHKSCFGSYMAYIPGYVDDVNVSYKRHWVKTRFTYDDFGSGLLSIFNTAIGSNWTAQMRVGMDIVNTSSSLQEYHSAYYVAFFIIAVIITRFLAFNSIVAVIVAYLSRIRMKYNASEGFTPDQQQYLKAKYIVEVASLNAMNIPKPNSMSRFVHRILTAQNPKFTHTHFHYFVQLVMFINCAFLAATTALQPCWRERMIFAVDIVGIVVCGIEILLRLVAYGPRQFCHSLWNIADVIILILIIIAASIPAVSFMRVFRVVKLLKGSRTGKLLYSINRNKKWFFVAFILYCTVLLVYATVGTQIFSRVRLDGIGLTVNRNFRTVSNSLLLMFQISTSDGWEQTLFACNQDTKITPCVPGSDTSECGSVSSSVIFFVTYIIVTFFLLLQLFMALFIDIFTTRLQDGTTNAFLQFRSVWLENVGPGKTLIDLKDFLTIAPLIPHNITGFSGDSQKDVKGTIRFLSALRVPLDSKYLLRYHDILHGLVYNTFRIDLRRHAVSSYDLNDKDEPFTAAQAYAAEVIQRYWRQRRCAKQAERLAMLDVLHERKGSKRRLTEVRTVDSFKTMSTTEVWTVEDARPFRVRPMSHLPRGALAVPGTSLFMFDFLESVFPGIPSNNVRQHIDPHKHSEN